MKKYFFLVILLIIWLLPAFGQRTEEYKKDSTRLENLKKLLPTVTGRKKVDLLNEIAARGRFAFLHANRTDSILVYAQKAYNEASKLGYKEGVAMALLNLSVETVYENASDSTKASKEKYIRKALQIGEETHNNEILGYGYHYLSLVPSIANDFEKQNDYYKKAADHYLKAGDTCHAAEVTNWLTENYWEKGEYERAFDYGKKSVQLSRKTSEKDISVEWQEFLEWNSLENMSGLYAAAGDYDEAMKYLQQLDEYTKMHKESRSDMPMMKADLFCQMGRYDSALFYINRWISEGAGAYMAKGRQARGWAILGKIYLDSTKQYDDAIEIFSNWSDTLKKYHPTFGTTRYVISIGQAYEKKKNYQTALQFATKGLNVALHENERPEMMRGYQLLSSVYHQMGNNDSAYEYLLKYNTIRDSIQNKHILLRIYNSKRDAEDAQKEAQIGLLNKDNKIKEQQLKQQTTFRNFLIAAFLAIVFAGLYIFRNINLKRRNERLQQDQKEHQWKMQQLESENKHVELQKQSAELEMQALRAQMNPHFIFNSLSSINHFILKNESKTASSYLTRFSRLIRMVLINSQRSLITLEDELQMLELYLEMERLRFKNSFDYSITFLNTIDGDNILVPPLLLQPFCENAIWHGLMHKEGQGRLNIELSMENNVLNCTITDNGIGREKAEEMKSKSAEKEKSMGLRITEDRLNLLNLEKGIQSFYNIEDLKGTLGNSSGTRVNLKISYQKAMDVVNR